MKEDSLTILGIDWGEKEIGLALARGKIAFPFKTLKRKKDISNKIKEICQENKVKKIVLGLPLTLKGKEGNKVKEVKKFALSLENKLSLPVEFQDERFSTKEAERNKFFFSNFKDLHQKSAQIILQGYLESKN